MDLPVSSELRVCVRFHLILSQQAHVDELTKTGGGVDGHFHV